MHTFFQHGPRVVVAAIIVFLVMSMPTSAQELNRLTADELADGWISLFDGETLFGWSPAGKADWKVENGVIVVTEGDVCLLRTTTQFADYVLKVDFRSEPGTNSGVFLRTSPRPQDVLKDCYELNIAPPDNPYPTASFVGRAKVDAVKPSDQWRTFEVTAVGGSFSVKLDGTPLLEYSDPEPLGRGFIGLQHNQGKVEFRNVKLKPLSLAPIFNGRDLGGWRTYPDMASKFSVTPAGEISVRNGPGQLETERSYGDFVLQLECKTNGKHLNSGIFFRCIPGDKTMGYESQIHNGYRNGDRTKPIDCGTGGIFRRQDARRVVPDDFQWFSKTIIADGPHVAVWVNGYPVSDWTDRRTPDKNPRRGMRLEPGTIMIQGHDPTTDILFRNLRAGEMPVRGK